MLEVHAFLFTTYTIYWGDGIWQETGDISNEHVTSPDYMLLLLKRKYQSFKIFVISFLDRGKSVLMDLPFLQFCKKYMYLTILGFRLSLWQRYSNFPTCFWIKQH